MRGHKWTDRELTYIRKHIKGRSYAEMIELFNDRFGVLLTLAQMNQVLIKHKLHNGLTGCRFKPGNTITYREHHKLPIGTERITRGTHGIVLVKIANPNVWKRKHVIVWEKANRRKVPKGSMVIFADGNKLNFDHDNLLLVTRREMLVMNTRGLHLNNKELTKTGKLIADIMIAANDRKSNRKRYYRRKK